MKIKKIKNIEPLAPDWRTQLQIDVDERNLVCIYVYHVKKKKSLGPIPELQQEVSNFDLNLPFWHHFRHSHPEHVYVLIHCSTARHVQSKSLFTATCSFNWALWHVFVFWDLCGVPCTCCHFGFLNNAVSYSLCTLRCTVQQVWLCFMSKQSLTFVRAQWQLKISDETVISF